MSDDPKSQPEAEMATCQPVQSTEDITVSIGVSVPVSAMEFAQRMAASRRKLDFKAGTVVLLEDGEYSDFHVVGAFVLTTDCNLSAIAGLYCAERRAQHKPDDVWTYNTAAEFGTWLVAKGHARIFDHETVHTDDIPDWEERCV